MVMKISRMLVFLRELEIGIQKKLVTIRSETSCIINDKYEVQLEPLTIWNAWCMCKEELFGLESHIRGLEGIVREICQNCQKKGKKRKQLKVIKQIKKDLKELYLSSLHETRTDRNKLESDNRFQLEILNLDVSSHF